jgi:ABC-type transport system substrate-binding protein
VAQRIGRSSGHGVISHRRRAASTLALALLVAACRGPERADDVLVMASGADLESANPLVTTHPLSRQVQRHVLLVTLLRYDAALVAQPYYARRWRATDGGRTLTLTLAAGVRWQDGAPTTASDAAFTFLAARNPATGYARAAELASLDTVLAVNDTTLVLRFRTAPPGLPALLAELPILPAHLLASDWLRTARAKGLPERVVLMRHLGANLRAPVITLFALALPGTVAGSVFIETIFGWPGMGRLMVTAIVARDYPVVLGAAAARLARMTMAAYAAELLLPWADARVAA